MKKIALILILALFVNCLPGCAKNDEPYSVTYLDLFDTVTTITGHAENEKIFQQNAEQIHQQLLKYHQLFDIYNTYEGINNLKNINDHAGIVPVRVEREIIELLDQCREFYNLTDGKLNAAMGSVLTLWHEERSSDTPGLPGQNKLDFALQHMDFESIVINENTRTVYLADREMSLDMGAIAKGWALEQVAKSAPSGMLISMGSSIRATGPKDEAGTPWVIGIQNPDGDDSLRTIEITGGSVATSGDYQRYHTVDGKNYHHIIDPETGYPSEYWRSVTVICDDAGLADALSTALFLMDQTEGQALLDQFDAKAVWIDAERTLLYSQGFDA